MSILELLEKIITSAYKKTETYYNNFNEVYDENSGRYAEMTIEELKDEYERLKAHGGGGSAATMAKCRALKEEIDRRRGV